MVILLNMKYSDMVRKVVQTSTQKGAEMLRFFMSLALVLVFMSAQQAEAYYWEFKEHSSNSSRMRSEITNFISNGYIPVGLTFLQGRLNMLYVNDGSDLPSAWYLGKYAGQGPLKSGIDRKAGQGYTPMGLSYYGGNFYVIFVQGVTPISNWAIITSSLNLRSLKRSISPYVRQGLIPFGMGSTSRQFLTLMVNSPGVKPSAWSIDQYTLSRSAVLQGLERNEASGKVPWGFLHHGGSVFILYLSP